MAGGRGKRLYPLTEEIPKPMIEINGLPMIHHLILRLKKQGFYKFIISINYKKEKIKSYLGDGSKFDIEISYIEEKKPLGTAGSLALIPKLIKPAILLNADLITDIYFQDLLSQNELNNSDLIMVTKNEKVSISYGVVETQGKDVLSIKEKPNFDFLINTGIYLITEKVRKLVKKNQFLDMPDLVKKCLQEKLNVEHFLCTHNWLDIGRFETLKKAKEFI
jgi:NDP-sugar pyrophosphorylase family protein